VLNLTVNARDAMPDGGELTIETRMEERADRGGRKYVRVDVRDTGTGMNDATRAQLFEPFFTTKPLGKGTGLGLATVFGIVSQSNGFIEVETAEGRGTTFSVYLPTVVDPQSEPRGAEADVRAIQDVVLLLEDDAGVRAVMDAVLRAGGYDVVLAGTPAEALDRWRTEKHRISALVSDVGMPGGNGHEVLARLRQERPTLPAIFVSGYGPSSPHLPDVRCLRKPFTRDELLSALREALGHG
jgi:two-component system, cell cycle sensor histidine kinase and response regulator CckA